MAQKKQRQTFGKLQREQARRARRERKEERREAARLAKEGGMQPDGQPDGEVAADNGHPAESAPLTDSAS